jgi:hypothetical protein
VQTGGGGTATHGSDGVLAGLATGGLVLVATAGGLAFCRRPAP